MTDEKASIFSWSDFGTSGPRNGSRRKHDVWQLRAPSTPLCHPASPSSSISRNVFRVVRCSSVTVSAPCRHGRDHCCPTALRWDILEDAWRLRRAAEEQPMDVAGGFRIPSGRRCGLLPQGSNHEVLETPTGSADVVGGVVVLKARMNEWGKLLEAWSQAPTGPHVHALALEYTASEQG